MKYDCLIVDDEEVLSQSTCEYFKLFGVDTAWVSDADSCMSFFKENSADVILLDINLGNDSGFSLCKRLRSEFEIPILFISARTSDDDVLLALGIGGDDYIPKPYSLSVLLAKVNVVLKRYRSVRSNTYTFGKTTVDFERGRVTSGGRDIRLKAMEYKLLVYLIENKNSVLSKEKLFAHVWEDSITGDNTLNVHIRHLREKIEDNPNEPEYIKTIWGVGYCFEAQDT
jgi:two-component system response regulator RegX3